MSDVADEELASCANCAHWFELVALVGDERVGECWRHPPIIVDAVVAGFLRAKVADVDLIIKAASRRPFTREHMTCGEWDGGAPHDDVSL